MALKLKKKMISKIKTVNGTNTQVRIMCYQQQQCWRGVEIGRFKKRVRTCWVHWFFIGCRWIRLIARFLKNRRRGKILNLSPHERVKNGARLRRRIALTAKRGTGFYRTVRVDSSIRSGFAHRGKLSAISKNRYYRSRSFFGRLVAGPGRESKIASCPRLFPSLRRKPAITGTFNVSRPPG